MFQDRRNVIFFWSILGLIAITGVTFILISTRLGAGLTDDSYYYVEPARSALSGNGLNTSSLFPPFLPTVLTLLGLAGIDPLEGVRLLNAALFGLNIFLAGIVIRKLSGSILFALLGAGLVMTADSLFEVHTWAMSEPLFVFLTFAAILILSRYSQNQRILDLILGGILVGLAALTRYVGVCLAAGCAVYFLFFSGRSVKARVRDALVVGILGIAPVALYVVRNRLVNGDLFGDRPLVLTPLQPAFLVQGLGNVLNWFLPGRIVNGREVVLAILGIGLAAALTAWYFFTHRTAFGDMIRDLLRSPLVWLVICFNAVYLVLLFGFEFTSGAIHPGESFSNRYLAPVYFSFLVLWIAWLARVWKISAWFEKIAIAALFIGLLASYSYRTYTDTRALAENGSGYAGARWHVSETVAYLNNHPGVSLVSTGEYGIYFWTGRLPRSVNSFGSLDKMRSYLRTTNGFLVVIDSMPPDLYGLSADQLLEGMTLKEHFSEGSIYQVSH